MKNIGFIAIGLIAGAAVTTAAVASHQGRPGMRPGHGPGHLVERFDTNSDGRIEQAEIDAVVAAALEEFDTDGDGKLSLEEYQELWLKHNRQRMIRRFQRFDADASSGITTEELGRPAGFMMRRLDRNRDGVITAEEMEPRCERRGRRDRRGPRGDRGDW